MEGEKKARPTWLSICVVALYVYYSPTILNNQLQNIKFLFHDDFSKDGEMGPKQEAQPKAAEVKQPNADSDTSSLGRPEKTDPPQSVPLPDYFNPSPELMMTDPCGTGSIWRIVFNIIEGSPWGRAWHIRVLDAFDYTDVMMPGNKKACRAHVLTNGGEGYFDFWAIMVDGLPYWRGHWVEPSSVENSGSTNPRDQHKGQSEPGVPLTTRN